MPSASPLTPPPTKHAQVEVRVAAGAALGSAAADFDRKGAAKRVRVGYGTGGELVVKVAPPETPPPNPSTDAQPWRSRGAAVAQPWRSRGAAVAALVAGEVTRAAARAGG